MRISDWSSDVCSSDLVQPFAEERVGKAQNDGDRDNSSAVYLWPGRPSDQKESEHDRGQGDQNVAARAMQRGKGDLRGGARFPEGIERHVGKLPDEIGRAHV